MAGSRKRAKACNETGRGTSQTDEGFFGSFFSKKELLF
jgi:hypothetical protein